MTAMTPRWAVVLLAGLWAGTVGAGLCDACRELSFTADVGACKLCAGHTSSGSHKLCGECSRKQAQCEHCRKPVAVKKVDGRTLATRVERLNDPALAVRNAAEKELAAMGEAAHDALAEYLRDEDLPMEARVRLRRILKRREADFRRVVDEDRGMVFELGDDGRALTALRDGKRVWMAMLPGEPGTSVRLVNGWVVVEPGTRVFSPRVGEMVSMGRLPR